MTVIVIALWVMSLCTHTFWNDGKGTSFGLAVGNLTYDDRPGPSPPPRGFWIFSRGPWVPTLWWFTWSVNPPYRTIWIPLWMPTVFVIIPTAAMWWFSMCRTRSDSCAHCGYDRSGLVGGNDAKCPECGKVPRSPP